MKKLLSSDLHRLFRSGLFYLCLICSAGFAIFSVVMRFRTLSVNPSYPYPTADGFISIGILYGPILWASFIGLFLGTEYGEGALRNKLVVGHSRKAVYLSSLLTAIVAALTMHLAFSLPLFLFGTLLLEPFLITPVELAAIEGLSLLIIVASVSLFCAITICLTNRATGSVVSILLAFCLLLGSMSLYSALEQPEYFDAMVYINQAGEAVEIPAEENLNYLRGSKRQVYETVLDILPSGQAISISRAETLPPRAGRYPLYSLGFSLLTTGAGLLIFQKKNLR